MVAGTTNTKEGEQPRSAGWNPGALPQIGEQHLLPRGEFPRPTRHKQLRPAEQATKADQSGPNSRVQRRMWLGAEYGNQTFAVHPNRRIPKVAQFSEFPKHRHKR
jgi:hypothetical protein